MKAPKVLLVLLLLALFVLMTKGAEAQRRVVGGIKLRPSALKCKPITMNPAYTGSSYWEPINKMRILKRRNSSLKHRI